MGWWKVEGTSNLIGDGPLDVLGGAVSDIVDQYAAAFGRKPTPREWEALLFAVLGAEEDEYRPIESPTVVSAVHLETIDADD